MNEWRIVYTREALKDKRKAQESGFGEKIKRLIGTVKADPYAEYPPFEKLVGDLSGLYSRRINRQHRMVYEVHKEEHAVKVVSMWTHYE